ncbi:hypothetical protein BDW02DRAFT_121552 [Decorospora gaudefroyi]|uniref:Uncharacterized protein n=1 Tax=Decorospora gaudefroyi TaxID=184978 RepID=A0A6A5KQR9_9PLEO|nr:hypothetical protein BDW02DRAFT_121552 [Decorospora gaudefroyi]
MAPIPEADSINTNTDVPSQPHRTYWTKANIALTTVFALILVAIFLAALLFFLHRRREKKKIESLKSDKAGLLAHEDKTSMFSRHRASSVTLYVDSEADAHHKRSSTDTMHLIPLQVTPVEEARDPMADHTESAGTSVSRESRQSVTTLSSMMLSPISPSGEEAGDLGLRPAAGRSRSTSTASQRARYYESTPTTIIEMPPIPRIVHTPSD